jgi:hypothetical protein
VGEVRDEAISVSGSSRIVDVFRIPDSSAAGDDRAASKIERINRWHPNVLSQPFVVGMIQSKSTIAQQRAFSTGDDHGRIPF